MADRIDWNSPEVIRTIVLAGMGQTGKVIEQETGLSPARAAYRLRQLGLSDIRSAFRNGESPIARKAIRAAHGYAKQFAATQVRNFLGPQKATNGTHSPKIA